MANHNRSQLAPRSTGRATQKLTPNARSGIDRALYGLAVAIVIVLGSLIVQLWMTYNSPPTLAIHSPTLAPTPYASPTSTATPTVTPTPSTAERAAKQIPLLQESWDARDWQTAAAYLRQIALLDINYPGLQKAQCDTYLHWAEDLEEGCQIERVDSLYHQALSYCEDRDAILGKKTLALRYLYGKRLYEQSQWSQAAAILHTVYETDPGYAAGCQELRIAQGGISESRSLDTRSLLHASYLTIGQAHLEKKQIKEARQAAKAALELVPSSHKAKKLLKAINNRPTPTPSNPADHTDASGKRIEINIAKQRMYVWQNGTLLYNWVCSTGGPGTGTATGRYKVQSKIPEAWASTWSLRMPYWLGIYTVGPMENGIHALPIRSNGTTLWAGYLGTPVSYGCIILSTENARTLYHWANMGTPVWIHW